MGNEHDALFKIGFGSEDAARSQLRALLPEELAKSQSWSMGLRAVLRYTHRVGEVPCEDLAVLAEQAMGPEAREVVMTTAEKLMLEGERRLLLRQIRKRFSTAPDEIQKRIAQASQADLELWSDRILEATSLDEVFAE